MLWFKHFSDSRRNPKLLRVEKRLGESGYARFFKLLEIVGERGGKGVDFRPEINLNGAATDIEWLATEWGIKPSEVRSTLELFSKVGLIDEGAWTKSIIAVPQMLEYRDEYTGRRQKKSSRLKDSDLEKEKEVEVEEERNGQCPATLPIQSGDTGEGVEKPVFDPEDKLISVTGTAWSKLGLSKISEQYAPFVDLVRKQMHPKIDDPFSEVLGNILDLCGKNDVDYPPQILAMLRRYRKRDKPFYDYKEKLAATRRLRVGPQKV